MSRNRLAAAGVCPDPLESWLQGVGFREKERRGKRYIKEGMEGKEGRKEGRKEWGVEEKGGKKEGREGGKERKQDWIGLNKV